MTIFTILNRARKIASSLDMGVRKLAKPIAQFRRVGKGLEDGQMDAVVGNRKFTVSKHFDENIKHTGEWKLFVDGEWHNTFPSLKAAKQQAQNLIDQ